ncbi:Aldehyde/histidinol dehydrogenase [Niveomyces insectorum RCEF 264]|uniref:aldehyde dehydrogenase (NAD(+)) n=1 Tax=Niveomyces insectorum RCEF 264 TaxID=1081102 RepID=A0A167RTE2_9HYPO|nr:Aldehyde/histidinol dehydrogenase [Niveomyces insectorum RCEF 264]
MSPNPASIETKLFIGGEFVPGKAGQTFSVINPTTEEKVADVHEALVEDVDAAVAAAQKAFPVWSRLSVTERIAALLKLADLIERDRDEIARLEAVSMGFPVAEYLPCIVASASGIRHDVGLAHDVHGETSLNTPGYLNFTLRQPFGLAALAHEAGFPPGVINVLSGFGPTAGHALSSHMDVRKISFTGSTRAGKLIMEAASKSNMKRVCVEMGGKNPAVVFDDADLEPTINSVVASLHFNSGQICVSNSRVYVQRGIFNEFLERFKQKFTDVQSGDPLDPKTHFGPQVDRAQFDSILSFVNEAKADGAELVAGGERATEKGFFIKPTVFARVPPSTRLLTTEIFGPVVAVQSFATEEEVIAECNDTNYGLHAAVFTRDISRAHRMVQAFEAGMVTVNCSSETGPYDLPFGGWKMSGTGRENGKMGLESYYEIKSVTLKL